MTVRGGNPAGFHNDQHVIGRFGPGRKRKNMADAQTQQDIRTILGPRSIVLVGLMGCGKSAIGRRLAGRLGLPFVDADDEIEKAAGKSIEEIFADHGEPYFREGERKVVTRLLSKGPQVLATGGGAFMCEETRAAILQDGVSIWLRAELPLLVRRVGKRGHRPLLKVADPEAVLRDLMAKRYPVYETADLTVESRDVPHEVIVDEIVSRVLRDVAAPSENS
ncbi:Shikimate kinase I, AroE I [Hyphomicrobium sulfonivorans]|uniref:Shikimate kinase n=2 Tax=Hyphomicrobium sulfonivorans TaxID=121290 RepID=A0A109BCT6_HYPSL|nr:Shikimate kinase I, AroE I [Hyphomicrobium sulfonivorans]